MAADIFAQKGWICPKCGRVLAPSTMYCLWCCRDMKESITTTGTSIPKWEIKPITIANGTVDSSGTPYLVKTSSISQDSHEIAKDEPQTDCLEQFRVGLEYHTDTTHFGKTKGESVTTNNVEDEPQTDCAWK